MGVGTMAALLFVAVAVSALVINFGIAQADESEVEISFALKIEQDGTAVDVEVEANGLKPNEDFAMRAYSTLDCSTGALLKVGPVFSDDEGELEISGTISPEDIVDVNSVSIRDDTGGSKGPIVVCFQNTTP